MFQCPEDDVISRSHLPRVAVTSESWRWWPGQRWVALRRAGLRAKRYWSRWSPSWRQRPSQLPRWHQHTQPAQGGILSLGSTQTRVYSGTFYIPSHANWHADNIPPARAGWQYPPLPRRTGDNIPPCQSRTHTINFLQRCYCWSWHHQHHRAPGQPRGVPARDNSSQYHPSQNQNACKCRIDPIIM